MENIKKSYAFLSWDEIKYIAMITILLNHIATIFLATGTWLCELFLALGYFTAIAMIYFLVEGYHYTKFHKKFWSIIYCCISIGLFGVFNLRGGISHFNLITNLLYVVLAILGMGLSALYILFSTTAGECCVVRCFPNGSFIFYPLHLLILGIIRILL